MMQKLANDPSFWLSVWTLVGLLMTAAGALVALLIAWAKAKTAEYEAKSAKGTADIVAQGQGVQQVTLLKHGEQIAALEAVATQGTPERGQGTGAAVAPATPVAPPAANSLGPPPPGVTTPTTVPLPLSSAPAVEHTTSGIVLPDQAAPAP